MSKTWSDHAGRPVRLGKEIGRGGEGAVFEVAGDDAAVAKLYHAPPPADRQAKVAAMVAGGTPELLRYAAWPTAALAERPGGPVVGLVMPRVVGFKPVHCLYSPAQRRQDFPAADWKFLAGAALNLCAAFDAVHAAGHAVGDVNHSNALVSREAHVRLIDCDSFQVAAGGRSFRCEVGVPEFTPPELQGQSFRGVDRTADHDRFGLAVLVFHLLFMGRHPFAGRFSGAGDMPIERAVAEGRYAYGRRAPALQMEPPPRTLAPAAASPELADLFERAFAGQNRPAAGEWHAALKAFIDALTACPADAGHVFPRALSACPWCGLVARGAPNFFVTVAALRSPVTGATTFVLAAVWAEVEAVAPPDAGYRRPRKPAVMPTPLPPGVPAQRPESAADTPSLAATAASLVFFAALVTCCLWSPLRWPALGVAVLAFVVADVIGRHEREARKRSRVAGPAAAYAAEWGRRESRRADAERRLADAEEALKRTARSAADEFRRRRRELEAARDEHASLAARYDAARAKLDTQARRLQLEQFLDAKLIADAKVKGIGPKRQAMLASYGVETALDVTEEEVLKVPGFGPDLTGRLVAWRKGVEKGFRFDPARGVPPQAVEALNRQFRDARTAAEDRLRAGPAELRDLAARANAELARRREAVRPLVAEWAQAEADRRVMG